MSKMVSPLELDDYFKSTFNDVSTSLNNGNFSKSVKERIRFGSKGYRKGHNKSELFVHQHPDEVCNLLKVLMDEDVTSYLEIGVESGGSLFFLDSFFRTFNPKYDCSFGIDLKVGHPFLELFLDEYENEHDEIFKMTDCFDFTPDRKYDYIFIDNNLPKLEPMMACFDYYLPYANKIIGFHDINDGNYGAKKTFAKLSEEYETLDISRGGPGVGLVFIDEVKL